MLISRHSSAATTSFFLLFVLFPVHTCLTGHGRVVSGDWRPAAVQREGVWRDDGQEEALRLAGPDLGQICPHGERLLSVSSSQIRPHSVQPGGQLQ